MAYQSFTHQIWWVMVCYDLAHQIRCAKHTFSGRCDITPMVCCSFGGHSTPQFLQCCVRIKRRLKKTRLANTQFLQDFHLLYIGSVGSTGAPGLKPPLQLWLIKKSKSNHLLVRTSSLSLQDPHMATDKVLQHKTANPSTFNTLYPPDNPLPAQL